MRMTRNLSIQQSVTKVKGTRGNPFPRGFQNPPSPEAFKSSGYVDIFSDGNNDSNEVKDTVSRLISDLFSY